MDGDIKQSTVSLTIGSVTRTYRLWETNAPAEYDKDYTLHVYGDPHSTLIKDERERLVLVPDVDKSKLGIYTADHPQILTYRSGMYRADPSDLLPTTGQGGLEEILWAAIHSLHRGQD